jgi:putative photosynthetic complex assembly protein 2
MPPDLALWAQLYCYPLLVTLLLWAGLTGGLLWLNRCGALPARWTLLLTLPVLLYAHGQLWDVRHDLSPWGCYQGFLSGMLVWAWHELAFYSGVLTGPWRKPCPPDAVGWRRFGYAMNTHLYHELAVLAELVVLWLMHSGAHNPVGPLTFGLCWMLQHSAKLNVLLGVRHLQVDMLPRHLQYLGSFWRPAAPTRFFVASVIITTLLALVLWWRASTLAIGGGAIALSLLGALMTLGALEHWLLAMPHAHERPMRRPLVSRPVKPHTPGEIHHP